MLPRGRFETRRCVEMRLRLGLRPGPCLGNLQRSPDPLAGFREGGREVRMEGGRAKKERMGKERKGKAMQKGDIGFRGIDASGYPTAHQFHWEIYS